MRFTLIPGRRPRRDEHRAQGQQQSKVYAAAWWAVERLRIETDWSSLLRQHERAFRQLASVYGVSS
jgi:hypothetical protein